MALFSITLSPRISETDAVGHINNVSIAAWFEDLRVRYLRSLPVPSELHEATSFTLASVHIDYVAETHFGSEVTLEMHAVAVGNTSIRLEGELHQEGNLTARGIAVMVCWDPESRRPQRVPDSYRDVTA